MIFAVATAARSNSVVVNLEFYVDRSSSAEITKVSRHGALLPELPDSVCVMFVLQAVNSNPFATTLL